jgi:heptosyltransferase II
MHSKKIGIFIPNWIGDVAMCTPALRAIRRHFGSDAQLTGILRPYVAEVLAGTRWLDETILYNRHATDRRLHTSAVWRRMRACGFDAVVLMTNSFRAAAMTWMSGAPTRIGYVRYGRGPLLTHKLYCPRLGRRRLPTPAIDDYLNLAYALGCERESPRLELATLPADEAAADAVWNKLGLPSGDRVVVINSGGAYGAAKHWPSEYFAQLARQIASERGMAVLVICGPSEQAVAREIVAKAAHSRVVHLADEAISIGLSKACVRRSRLLITTDSGPRFFGVAFNIPVVSLFGPTRIQATRTHYDGEVCLQHAVPCGPCGARVCPLGHHDCMRSLSVARVYDTVLAELDRRASARAA